MNKGMKALITSAAAATAAAFVVISVPTASAIPLPCSGDPALGPAGPGVCQRCLADAAVLHTTDAICYGNSPTGAPVHYPDCDARQLPSDRAQCVDQHIAGQR